MTEMAAFTIRIPKSLAEQINARAKVQRRTRNAEITVLLEGAIDHSVDRDLETLKQSGSDLQVLP